MAQSDCLRVMKKGKWITIREMAEILNLGEGSASSNLKRLHKQGYIERKKVGEKRKFAYRIKEGALE